MRRRLSSSKEGGGFFEDTNEGPLSVRLFYDKRFWVLFVLLLFLALYFGLDSPAVRNLLIGLFLLLLFVGSGVLIILSVSRREYDGEDHVIQFSSIMREFFVLFLVILIIFVLYVLGLTK